MAALIYACGLESSCKRSCLSMSFHIFVVRHFNQNCFSNIQLNVSGHYASIPVYVMVLTGLEKYIIEVLRKSQSVRTCTKYKMFPNHFLNYTVSIFKRLFNSIIRFVNLISKEKQFCFE
jgi:hypothetical protein